MTSSLGFEGKHFIILSMSNSITSSTFSHFEVKDREEVFRFHFGEIQFELKGLKRELGQTLSSTGLTLWRASEHLSSFCHAHADLFRGKRVLELGAGIGNVSILIDKLRLAKMVVATDGDDDTVELLDSNVTSVQCNVIVRKLYWGQHADFKFEFPDLFDVLVAADVIYEDDQIIPLFEAVIDLLHSEGSFYLAYARRNIAIDKVLAVAQDKGLVWSVEDVGDGSEPIYKFTWLTK